MLAAINFVALIFKIVFRKNLRGFRDIFMKGGAHSSSASG
jgi:hypothetical protein